MSFFEHPCVCDRRYLFTDIIAEARECCAQIEMQNSKNSKQSGATSETSGLFTMMSKNHSASASGGGGVRRPVVSTPSQILSNETAVSLPKNPSNQSIAHAIQYVYGTYWRWR